MAAKAAVSGISYTGGWTNTEQAILKCNATLNTSTADVKFIALFTDGAPTVFGFTDTSRDYHIHVLKYSSFFLPCMIGAGAK